MGYHNASAEEIKDGCPAGKTALWVTKSDRGFLRNSTIILSGYLIYDTLEEALADMAPKLQFHDGEDVFVNHKSEDGQQLDIWTLKHSVRKKQGRL